MQSYTVDIPEEQAGVDAALDWQLAVQEFMGDEAERVGAQGLNVVYSTSRSMDDALSESVSGEIYLFVATCERVGVGTEPPLHGAQSKEGLRVWVSQKTDE